MIDLSSNIRSFLIDDSSISTLIPNYLNSKAVFTRRPVPQDAPKLLVVISPMVTMSNEDFLNSYRRTLTYDIAVYGQNDTSPNYRKVEEIANKIAMKFARPIVSFFPQLSGWRIANIVGTGPIPGPTDDNDSVARIIMVDFTINKGL